MDRVRMLMFVHFRFSFLIPYHNTVSGRPEEDTQVKKFKSETHQHPACLSYALLLLQE